MVKSSHRGGGLSKHVGDCLPCAFPFSQTPLLSGLRDKVALVGERERMHSPNKDFSAKLINFQQQQPALRLAVIPHPGGEL